MNRDDRVQADIRYYEAAMLDFDVFSLTPAALEVMRWFFALSDEHRMHLVRTLA